MTTQPLEQHYRSDEILIQGLELQLRIGCTAEERSQAQQVLLNIRAGIGRWAPAAQTGSMDSTVDYLGLALEADAFAKTREWVLLEELAEALALNMFSFSPVLQSVDIEARKFSLPQAKWAGVRFYRTRAETAQARD